MTVICGIDGSAQSLAAAQWAAEEAQLREEPLELVTACSHWDEAPTSAQSTLAVEAYARKTLDSVQGALQQEYAGVEVRSAAVWETPAQLLLDEAVHASLVVLGSRGIGGFRGLLLGSTGLVVAAASPCPVVLVRAGRPGFADRLPVVVGIDAREPAEEVLDFAMDEAARRGVPLRAVHVGPLPALWPPYAYPLLPEDRGALVASEQKLLGRALADAVARHPGLDVVADVSFGQPAGVLVDEAQHAALLVVGRKAGRPPSTPRLGSVGHAVIHHAVAPVAVVPHATAP